MQYELKLSDWVVDSRTGYLRHKNMASAVTPEMKELFLEAFVKLGTAAGACKVAGFGLRLLPIHKRADKKFNEDYNLALQEMADTLESVMYLNAQQPRGTLDRFGWLRAHFPKKWNPKFLQDDKDTKKVIDQLWSEIESEKK